MTPKGVREYAEAVRPRYLAAKRADKGRILTEFCAVTGYHRDSAIRLLRRRPAVTRARRGRPRTYGPGVRDALKAVWEAADRICSKRLAPYLPTLLEALEAHGEIRLSAEVRRQLLGLSAATMDRLLKPYRGVGGWGRGLPTPPDTTAPEAALGSLPSVALSSAQAPPSCHS
ncbi:MAG: hypothetical protein HY331_00865 [Chloroflexi bacterium]|nr:hypothetical protein [Chloroflexota bacterium]